MIGYLLALLWTVAGIATARVTYSAMRREEFEEHGRVDDDDFLFWKALCFGVAAPAVLPLLLVQKIVTWKPKVSAAEQAAQIRKLEEENLRELLRTPQPAPARPEPTGFAVGGTVTLTEGELRAILMHPEEALRRMAEHAVTEPETGPEPRIQLLIGEGVHAQFCHLIKVGSDGRAKQSALCGASRQSGYVSMATWWEDNQGIVCTACLAERHRTAGL